MLKNINIDQIINNNPKISILYPELDQIVQLSTLPSK